MVDDVGQIAARAGFGIALAPQFGDVEDLRQEPLLLLGGAEGDQRRSEQFLAEVIHLRGGVGDRVLLVERDAMRDSQPTAAVFLRPAEARIAGGREMLVPRPSFLERLILATRALRGL